MTIPLGSADLAPTFPPDSTLVFIHISDTHISHDPAYQLPQAPHTPAAGARALVEAVNAVPFTPDFVLHTGDVAYDPVPDAYHTARDILREIRWPTYYLNGNHDDAAALQRMMLGREAVTAPLDYEFEAKGVQLVVVDSNGPAVAPAGSVTEPQLERLRRIAADPDDRRPLVVATHHNVLPNGSPWWDTFMGMTNGEAFHAALLPARHRLRGVLHGHTHQETTTIRDGILYCGIASSWYQLMAWPGQVAIVGDRETPAGFNVVVVTPEQMFIRRHHFSVRE